MSERRSRSKGSKRSKASRTRSFQARVESFRSTIHDCSLRLSLSILKTTTIKLTNPGRDGPAPADRRNRPDRAAGPRRRVGEGRVAVRPSSSIDVVLIAVVAAPAAGSSPSGAAVGRGHRGRGSFCRDGTAIRSNCDRGAARPPGARRGGAGAGRSRRSSIRRRPPRARRGSGSGSLLVLLRAVRLLLLGAASAGFGARASGARLARRA